MKEPLDQWQDFIFPVGKHWIEGGNLSLRNGDQSAATDKAAKLHFRAEGRVPFSKCEVEGQGGGIRGGIRAGGEGLREIVCDGVGGAEEEGDLGEGGTAKRAISGDPGSVLGGAPIELREHGATEIGDGASDGGLKVRERWGVVIGVRIGVHGGERGGGIDAGGSAGERIEAGGGSGEEETGRVSGGMGIGLAEEVADEGIGERMEEGFDGVRLEAWVPVVDLASPELRFLHCFSCRSSDSSFRV